MQLCSRLQLVSKIALKFKKHLPAASVFYEINPVWDLRNIDSDVHYPAAGLPLGSPAFCFARVSILRHPATDNIIFKNLSLLKYNYCIFMSNFIEILLLKLKIYSLFTF